MTGFISTALAAGSGAIVGIVLGLIGGGGSILAVPLLVYVVGAASTHVAIGTSALAVSVSALGGAISHARAGNVKWRCASVFAASGVGGALIGSGAGKSISGDVLLSLFGLLMILVGLAMFRRRSVAGDPKVRLSLSTAWPLLPLLIGIGFAVGVLSGFFGIGGGFLIVPGLMLATGMPIGPAIGTSLVAVAAFGATTAASYAYSALIDWPIAAGFIFGGVAGAFVATKAAKRLGANSRGLTTTFAVLVTAVGVYIALRGLPVSLVP